MWESPKVSSGNSVFRDLSSVAHLFPIYLCQGQVTRRRFGTMLQRIWAVGTTLISLGLALVASSLCRAQEKHKMRESEVQIGMPDKEE